MAVNSPFFSKREPQTLPTRPNTPMGGLGSTTSTPSSTGMNTTSTPVASEASVRSMDAALQNAAADQGGSKLTVGPNIKLKGVEITDCDTLVVEGTVEATMDSRVIHIAQQGAFHGSADIDIAEIHGEFTGTLTVRQKLVIHSTGKVSGKIRYGKIVIEEGGQVSGEIEVGVGSRSDSKTAPAAASKAATPVAA